MMRAAKISVSPADDGKLSLDEFQAFFSDGTLNEEELEKLFHTIDSDNTRWFYRNTALNTLPVNHNTGQQRGNKHRKQYDIG